MSHLIEFQMGKISVVIVSFSSCPEWQTTKIRKLKISSVPRQSKQAGDKHNTAKQNRLN